MITFESLDVGNLIHAHVAYLRTLWIEFVYEGHWVKITGAKKVENSYFHNVKLPGSQQGGKFGAPLVVHHVNSLTVSTSSWTVLRTV